MNFRLVDVCSAEFRNILFSNGGIVLKEEAEDTIWLSKKPGVSKEESLCDFWIGGEVVLNVGEGGDIVRFPGKELN